MRERERENNENWAILSSIDKVSLFQVYTNKTMGKFFVPGPVWTWIKSILKSNQIDKAPI